MLVDLASMPQGSRARVVAVYGGPGLRTRLMEMGLSHGSIVEVVNNNRGPVLVRVRGVIVAVGRGMASRILVEPLAP
jgi:ferrous iron transport protein A